MFFGSILKLETSVSSRVSKVKNLMGWGGIYEFSLNFHDFYGGFFLNNKLPYKPEDFLFRDDKRELLVLMSGNVYNRPELQQNNSLSPHLTNPELVAALFNRYGPGFVEKLNGDFAICVYDFKNEELFLFRDHLGIQPLFYTVEKENLYFSSDQVSLGRTFFDQKIINMEPYLTNYKAINHLDTLNSKVKKLIPGHYLHFSQKGEKITKYWFPEKVKTNYELSYDEVKKNLGNLVEDAIKIRSDKRYFAGAHLSGGLDSGLVAALTKKNYSHQDCFKVFSYSPEGEAPKEAPWDERLIVKEIAAMHNMDAVFCTLNKKDYQNYINDFFNNRGYFSEQKTIEKAHENNVNLIFTGWGGNEFISKEGAGIDSDLLFQLRLKKFFERNPIRKPRKIARTLYYFIFLPALNILDHQMVKSYNLRMPYLKKEHKKHFKKTLKKYFFYRSRLERQLNFIYNYYIPELPEHWSVWGYKNGVEYRYPLLDKRIIEFILQIPSHLLCRGETERILIRDLTNGLLPDSVFKVPKYIDPVYFRTRASLTTETGTSFVDEAMNWADNPDLYFVDFELLKRDIASYKKNPEDPKFDSLKSNLFYFKMLHEFTKTYRSLPEGLEKAEPGEVHDLNTDAADAIE